MNFIISKRKFNIGREIILLTEIKQRPTFIKEIYRRKKINFNTNNEIIFKEAFTIPHEQRFYNRIFMLHIYNKNLIQPPNNQNQIVNNKIKNNFNNTDGKVYNNFNNNGISNAVNFIGFNDNGKMIGFKPNNNNTNEKVHLKGHTGFF